MKTAGRGSEVKVTRDYERLLGAVIGTVKFLDDYVHEIVRHFKVQ